MIGVELFEASLIESDFALMTMTFKASSEFKFVVTFWTFFTCYVNGEFAYELFYVIVILKGEFFVFNITIFFLYVAPKDCSTIFERFDSGYKIWFRGVFFIHLCHLCRAFLLNEEEHP